MKLKLNKAIALILAAIMALTSLSVTAFADDDSGESTAARASSYTWQFGISNGAATYDQIQGSANSQWLFTDNDVYGQIYLDLSNGGKLSNSGRSDDLCQINTNTVLWIPATTGTKLTIGNSSGYPMTYTLGSATGISDASYTYTVTSDDLVTHSDVDESVTQFVKLTVTSGNYFSSISAANPSETTAVRADSYKWSFGISDGAATYNQIQGSANSQWLFTENDEYGQIYLDLSNGGKLSNYGRSDNLCQINTNTVLWIPATTGTVLTVENSSGYPMTYTLGSAAGISDASYTYTVSSSDLVSHSDVTVTDFVKLTVTSGNYFSSISAENPATSGDDSGDDDDDSGSSSSDSSSFTWWFDEVNDGGTVSAGTYSAGNGSADITVNTAINDASYSAQSNASFEYTDGTTHAGYWASNRPSNAGSFTNVSGLENGSAYYFTLNTAGTVTVYNYVPSGKNFFVKECDEDGDVINTTTTEAIGSAGVDSLTFTGTAGYTYVVTTGGTNGLRFFGFKFLVDDYKEVGLSFTGTDSFTSTSDASLSSLVITFTDVDNGDEFTASYSESGTTIELNNGHTYEISSSDSSIGAALSSGATEFIFDGSNLEIALEEIPNVTLTGKITSETSDNAANVVSSITFTKMSDSTVTYTTDDDDIDASAGTYSITLKPGEYNTSVVTTDGSYTNDRVSVSASGTNENEIYLESSGEATYYLPTEVSNSSSKLTFSSGISYNNDTSVSCGTGSTITVPVSGVQKVTVAGWYKGTWDINGENSVTTDTSAGATSPTTTSYTTDGSVTSVTVNITSGGYLYWISVENATSIAYTSSISVPSTAYPTLTDAITAVNNIGVTF